MGQGYLANNKIKFSQGIIKEVPDTEKIELAVVRACQYV